MMEKVFDLHRVTRENLLEYLDKYSLEELCFIPKGFKNSIFWNTAHCVATQQLLCYKSSGVETRVSMDFVNKYCKGTIPDGSVVSKEELEFVKMQLIATQQYMKEDYENGVFRNDFKVYKTSYNYELTCVEDAINFNNVHEGMHLGIVKSVCYFI